MPICPLAPITPIGSTSYREGVKAGTSAGEHALGGNSGGANPQSDKRTYCDGFSEGWKVVKGNLAIVPMCPIPPITPMGSTPYREGLNAGMERGRKP